MLTIVDVPQEVSSRYQQSKQLAAQLFASVRGKQEEVAVPAQTSLKDAYPSRIVYIVNGMVKYLYNDKFIRFYSTGDILDLSSNTTVCSEVISEFAIKALVLERDEFRQLLTVEDNSLSLWMDYQQATSEIMHALTSLFTSADFKPDIDMRQYHPGAVIIRQGDNPDSLFEMIEGAADVYLNSTKVGEIGRGEVFGEISFLAASPRTASVTATRQCLVQAINGADFEKIVTYRPALIYSLSKTLAKRLTDVNEKLIRIASLT
ncbi:MAG: cyclic nucleotide-binding domain-containing protein [Chitinivibrionales bacterium]|nr:cyclic nucleotide-binding domain-containing protein [Chitinivibrionales bacterium]